jgi:DivIVA domain-containing protein
VDQSTGIEKIRTATFTLARRGYDKREVEQFLNRIADWLETGGGDQARADIVRRELERVGQRTAGILATAEDSAEQIRADAREDAEEVTAQARAAAANSKQAADEYSEKTRGAADEYAARVRGQADEYAQKSNDAAQAKARRIVEEGVARRRDLEAVISDLVARRDQVIGDANRLSSELRKVADGHAPDRGADRFEEPSELDPADRVRA